MSDEIKELKKKKKNVKVPAIICTFLGWPVKAIVTEDMHSLLEQTDINVQEHASPLFSKVFVKIIMF